MYPSGPAPSVKETACRISQSQGKRGTRGYDATHGRRGDVILVTPVIFHHLIDAVIVSYEERRVLSSRVEISGIRDMGSSDIATRQQRATTVTFLDYAQGSGGPDGCVVCLYNPRFVFLDANGGIVTDPSSRSVFIWQRIVRVYGETTGRRETGIKSDENRFDSGPSLIINRTRVKNRAGMETVCYAIVPPSHYDAWIRRKEPGRVSQELTEVGYR